MIKIIALMIFAINALAFESYHSILIEALYGVKSADYTEPNNEVHEDESKYFTSVNSYNDFIFDGFSITSTLNFTTRSSGYSRIYHEVIGESYFFEVSELAFNYSLTDEDIVSLGVFSLKNGQFSEHTKIGMEQTDSLMTLYYLNLAGAFYTRHFENSKVQFGYAAKTNLGLLSNDRYDTSTAGSDITFLFTTTKINKHKLVFNISTSQLYHETNNQESKKLGDLAISGIGYEYNDLGETGNLLYSIFGLSKTHIDSLPFSPTGKPYVNDSVSLTAEPERFGYSLLLGAKREYDSFIFSKDIFTGIEYFYASKYWASYVTDRASADEYTFGDLGHSFKIYSGIDITPKFKISMHYRHTQVNYNKKIGSNVPIVVDNQENKFYIRTDILF